MRISIENLIEINEMLNLIRGTIEMGILAIVNFNIDFADQCYAVWLLAESEILNILVI